MFLPQHAGQQRDLSQSNTHPSHHSFIQQIFFRSLICSKHWANKGVFFSDCFQDFSLCLLFLPVLKIWHGRYGFLCIYSACIDVRSSYIFLNLWLGVFYQFWKILSHYVFKYSFCLMLFFHLFGDSNYMCVIPSRIIQLWRGGGVRRRQVYYLRNRFTCLFQRHGITVA